ncbi:hypothetical protein QTI33_12135 [Variovorax sp. J22P271]|uniref:hypothetical protein n=1 Tax=Variovorax davisae TaxID=3053515 RepID=UPI002577EDB3|nr:hypothetical protein [Variovorax sp. J22P271]MDM0032873.1 hypothetical protein [Variovorax sp. J22P271]
MILETGLNSYPGEAGLTEACKKFKPTASQIKDFFSKAYPVPGRFGAHERYASCYASGTMVFSDFGKVSWGLTSGGTATYTFDDGHDDTVQLYYRGYKWFDPTACEYGDGEVKVC